MRRAPLSLAWGPRLGSRWWFVASALSALALLATPLALLLTWGRWPWWLVPLAGLGMLCACWSTALCLLLGAAPGSDPEPRL